MLIINYNFFLHWNPEIIMIQSPTLIERWFILIKHSFTLTEQPPTPKTASPDSKFLKLGSHA